MGRARRVVVLIGTNDLLQLRSDGIEQRYRAVLAKVPARIQVTLVSVPPLDVKIASAQDVRAVVQASRRACAADARCTFVDAHAALSLEDGTPQPGVLLPDGIHLSSAGYARLIRLLRAPAGAGAG